jgi:hypothetical protein
LRQCASVGSVSAGVRDENQTKMERSTKFQ